MMRKLLLNTTVVAFLCFISLNSCKEEVLPKPKAQLRLEYPEPSYNAISTDCPFIFDTLSQVIMLLVLIVPLFSTPLLTQKL